MLKQLNYLISFLDKFILTQKDTNTEVPWTAEYIAWKSDRETKFKNPTGDISGFSKPPRWFQNVTNLGIEDKEIGVGVGLVNQDFINWMRVAAFPTFRKLYRKLNHGKNTTFAHGLPAGNYKLTIQYSEFDNQSFIDFLRCFCLQSTEKFYEYVYTFSNFQNKYWDWSFRRISDTFEKRGFYEKNISCEDNFW